MDRADGQIAFEFLEGLFHFGELEVKLPQLRRIAFPEVGAQQVAPFAAPGDAQGRAIKLPADRGALFVPCAVELHLGLHEACIASGVLLGRSESLMQGVAFHWPLARLDVREPVDVGAQASPAHGALFGDAIPALGEHMGFALLVQQLHAHAGPCLFPFALDQGRFQRGEFALGRAHQITHRRLALAHELERFLRRDATVHDPDATGFAVLIFDLAQEVFERGFIRGVSRQHFIGQGEALGRDEERDDHLHAIAAFVAAVTEAAHVRGVLRRVALEVSAREVVEEHFVFRIKEIAPALREVIEERAFVLQDLVVAFVEPVDLSKGKVPAEQISDGRVIKPMAAQPPLLRAASRRSPLRGSLRLATSSLGSAPGSIKR